MNTHRIILGDCIEGMKTLPDGCVQTCITSPPYFGLRDYGTANWKGGDSNCDHVADPTKTKKFGNPAFNENRPSREQTKVEGYYYKDVCGKCGATCEDSQIGQEDTVEGYVEKMVEVFREVKRILRDDGTLWLNLGDSYMSAKNCAPPPQTVGGQRGMPSDFIPGNRKDQKGLKTKDLIGIPWRVAFALQADGWYLRQDIIWNKPNPMPESVEDRCTKAHEYIFLLSKKSHYHYDHEAVKETTVGGSEKKNKRSVWTVNSKGYKGAHFAVYPEDLILPCVLAGCPKDGTVFDPFTGSGTTAVVALKNGRNYIGTELNPEYVKIAEDRIKESVPQTLSDFLA
jgi:site-specific DNA-methyltransferase (adenine-specific)